MDAVIRSRPPVANGLHWIRSEIEASLVHARAALEHYLESPEDPQPLRSMAEELRQVHGTMRMIQCFGAAALAQEMLALLDATLAGQVETPEDAFSALSGAMLQLSDYIDLLAHGEDDRAVVLQPVINELRLARRQTVVTEADLFAAQARAQLPLPPVPGGGAGDSAGDGAVQTVARRELPGFQLVFLQWFRGSQVDESMRRIGQIADSIAVNLKDPALVQCWTGFAALAECLVGSQQPDSLDLKRLFGRAGSLLRALAEHGEAAARAQAGDTGWQLLFHIARAPYRTARAEALLVESGCSALLPEAGQIDALRQRLRGPNSGILDRLYLEIGRDFTRIKDGIDLAVRTGGRAPAELAGTRERLSRLANTMATLGLPAPQQTLSNQVRALDVPEPEAQQWMELATAILRVEHSLEEALFRALGRHDGGAARPFAVMETEIPHAQDLRNSRRALLRETLIDLARLKSGVDDFLKTGNAAGLADGPPLLHQTAAVLRIAGDERAADLLLAIERYAASGSLGSPLAQAVDYARYADAIACAELFIEALRDGLPRTEPIVDDLQRFVDRLEVRAPAPTVVEPEAVAAVAVEPPASAAPPPAPASVPVSEGIDPEIREVFVEEAGEVLAELQRLLPQLLRAPDDRALLADVRRAFHTLKGSGRMVGALRIGEFAWALESLLNRCLEGALAVRKPVLDVVAEAISLLPQLIDDFRGLAGEPAAVADLLSRAADVAAGRIAPETDMLAVFVDDAHERLAFAGRWLETRDLGDREFPVDAELIRAFHTLKGSAAVVNGGAVSQLAALFEHHFNTLRFEGRALSADSLGVIADGLVELRTGIERIGAGRADDADPERLAHWRARLEPAAGAPPAQPARPPVDEAASVEALDLLQAIELQARAWTEQPAESAAAALVDGLNQLAAVTRRAGAAPIAALAGALGAGVRPWIGGGAPGVDFFATLLDLIEVLYQLLDEYREGGASEASAALARAQSLPPPPAAVFAPAAQPATALDLDPELLEIFGGEAEELLEALDRDHRLLMAEPARAAVIDDLKRTLHTLKGSARTAGALAIGDVAHHLETRLEDAHGSAGPALLARLEAGFDGLHGLVDGLLRGEARPSAPVLEAIARAVPRVEIAAPPPAPPAETAIGIAPEFHAPALEDFDAMPDPDAAAGFVAEPWPEPSVASTAPPPESDPIVLEDFDRDALAAPAAPPAEGSTLTVTMETPAAPMFTLDASTLRSLDAPPAEAPLIETVSVETLPLDARAGETYVADTFSVSAEMPPLADFDQPVAVSGDATLPGVDPAREVHWSSGEPEAPLPPLEPSVTPVIDPLPEHSVTTSAHLSAAAPYAEPAAGPVEPLSVTPATLGWSLPDADAGFTGTTPPDAPPVPPPAPSVLDVELTDIFSAEAAELLESLDAALEAWRNGDGGEPVLDIQRALHTLKGGARMAGLETMGDVAHEFESRVNAVVASGDFPDADTFHALRAELEALQTLHDRLRRGEAAILPAVASVAAEPRPALPSQWSPELFWRPEESLGGLGAQRRETARVPVEALDAMLNEAGEISIYRSRLEEHNAGLRVQLGEMTQTIARVREQLRMMEFETEAQIAARGLSSTAGEGGSDRYAQDFDPLEMDRYSRMQELSRALAESINDLSSLQATMDQVVGDAETLLQQQSRINTEVQQGLMGTLMVPFSRQLQRLARVVRQTAQENGKLAEVQFAGAEAELDRNVLERMTAPLEHLLRNAVVHGIEAPQRRLELGKPETGQIRVQLRREGAQLLVEVGDDGGGLDFLGIREKAIERQLMAPDAQASDDDLARFIFEPGFSTARTLTQDAGRGIGMDVVSSEVKQLGGTLELRSEIGRGTRFLVRLPLTLAVSQALLVGVGGENYAVPLASVEGIARIQRRELDDYFRPDGPLFAYGGRGYRVSYLGDYLGLAAQPAEAEGRTLTAILVRIGEGLSATHERRVALIVDTLIGNREIVSKTAGPQLSAVPGVAGATILADGRVVLILDVPALVSERARRALLADAAGRAVPSAAVDARELVMVVDDSVTMRRVAERLLTRNGYRVVTARDGLDAMAMLQTETPSTLLLDIEMPRADGFEVAAFVRNTPRLATTPIIMITSRSGEKHRERARGLRVDRYLIKPYQEEQLLGEITAVRRGRGT